MPPPPRPPPELIDDAATEILLRLPPDDPACLARAALVCRRWRRVLSDPAFRRRYGAFHGPPPPLLGFVLNREYRDCSPRFVATAAASPFSTPAFEDCDLWQALDCRHGRALFFSLDSDVLFVWDPATGGQHQMIRPEYPCDTFGAAVLCAADGCDHLDCHGGPFRVVFVGVYNDTWAILYSSEAREWSAPAYLGIECSPTASKPARLVGDALYFVVDVGLAVLKYDLAARRLSLLDDMLPFPALPVSPTLLGFAEGADIIFINTNIGAIAIELRSGQVKKVGKSRRYYSILPYMSFYTPDLSEARLQLT